MLDFPTSMLDSIQWMENWSEKQIQVAEKFGFDQNMAIEIAQADNEFGINVDAAKNLMNYFIRIQEKIPIFNIWTFMKIIENAENILGAFEMNNYGASFIDFSFGFLDYMKNDMDETFKIPLDAAWMFGIWGIERIEEAQTVTFFFAILINV